MKWIDDLRAARLRRISPWRAALADLPAGLEIYWRASAPREYEGILGGCQKAAPSGCQKAAPSGCQKAAPRAAFFFANAAEGLLRFFDAVRHSGRPCALPSEAADSVWHAWLRWNPISLDHYCRRHFGIAVPHVERAALAPDALLHTFAACCARDGFDPGSTRLPALFGLDAALRMPGGHGYWNRAGEIRYARLNARGRGMWRALPHPELALPLLVAEGLVDRRFLVVHERRRPAAAAAADGSSCGGIDSLAFADGDACADGGGGGDGGCDSGGSSCGCSCGSGCGGGGD